MRKIIILINIFICVGVTLTQFSFLDNYMYARTYLDYHRNKQFTKATEIVLYFERQERPKQIFNRKTLSSEQDAVTPITSDTFIGQIPNYLPIPQAGNLNRVFTTYPLNNGVDAAYCSEKISPDTSSLNRILEQNNWVDKSVKFEYHINVSQENLVESNQLI
ncbi:MAG: DUF6443 domain-containing protein [Chryseobacterium jejuense]|uniref:DUF6443 domain-containing protein n=1 Tax=Chryseobacterium jejuense TaxID=445960 RepID=UPI003D0DBD33